MKLSEKEIELLRKMLRTLFIDVKNDGNGRGTYYLDINLQIGDQIDLIALGKKLGL